MPDAEGVEDARQRPDPGALDALIEVGGTLLREALQGDELIDGQPEDVGGAGDEPALKQLIEDMPAGALDVHAAPTDEVAETLDDLGGAKRVAAAVADLSFVLDDLGMADGAGGRHLPDALGAGAALHERPDDLRDDVARLLEDDLIADPDVLAADLVEVVERGPGDGRAGDPGRAQVGDRRQRPGPPDIGHDVLDERLDLLGGELEGDRPARSPRDHAQAALLVEAVDLDDDAVGLVGRSWRASRHDSVKAMTPSMSSPEAHGPRPRSQAPRGDPAQRSGP